MAFRLLTPLLLAFSFFLYLGYLNPSNLSFAYAPDKTINLPFVVVLLIAFFSGALSFAIFNAFFYIGQYLDLLSERYSLFRKGRSERKVRDAIEKMEGGRNAKALKSVEKALAIDPGNFEALMLKGNILRDEGKFKDAVEIHSLALAQRPKDKEAIIQLNRDYAKARRPDAAYRILERARVLHPDDTEIMENMRDLAETMGDLKRSIVLQKETIKRLKNKEATAKGQEVLATLHCKHALELLRKRDSVKAEDELVMAGRVSPGFLPAAVLLANIAVESSRPDDAEKLLRREFKRTHSIALLRKLETVFMNEGMKENAVDLYRWAMGNMGETPASKRLLIFLAMAQIKSGDHIGADGTLNRASKEFESAAIYNLARGVVEISLLPETDKSEKVYVVYERFKKALHAEWDSYLRYICGSCGWNDGEYFIYCPKCRTWNSAVPKVDGQDF
ncbi:MAG: tetratricopeptide repeat protein [Nitrospinota bacterium]|nr:tetratricopeptide repeat protein [Nitrospinota bacterium]